MMTSQFSQLLIFTKYTHGNTIKEWNLFWSPLWKRQGTLTFSKAPKKLSPEEISVFCRQTVHLNAGQNIWFSCFGEDRGFRVLWRLLYSSLCTGVQDSILNPERTLSYCCGSILLLQECQALHHSLYEMICHEKSTVMKIAKFRKAKTFNQGLLKRFCQEVGAIMKCFATHKFTGFRRQMLQPGFYPLLTG